MKKQDTVHLRVFLTLRIPEVIVFVRLYFLHLFHNSLTNFRFRHLTENRLEISYSPCLLDIVFNGHRCNRGRGFGRFLPETQTLVGAQDAQDQDQDRLQNKNKENLISYEKPRRFISNTII